MHKPKRVKCLVVLSNRELPRVIFCGLWEFYCSFPDLSSREVISQMFEVYRCNHHIKLPWGFHTGKKYNQQTQSGFTRKDETKNPQHLESLSSMSGICPSSTSFTPRSNKARVKDKWVVPLSLKEKNMIKTLLTEKTDCLKGMLLPHWTKNGNAFNYIYSKFLTSSTFNSLYFLNENTFSCQRKLMISGMAGECAGCQLRQAVSTAVS